MNETTLKMHTFTTQLLIEVELWDKLKGIYRSLYLTFDTGAVISTLPAETLHNMGYEPSRTGRNMITTASGVEFVSQYTLDRLNLNGIELSDVDVYALKFPEESFSLGVIGLNILRNFDIELLFSQNIVKLKRIGNNT